MSFADLFSGAEQQYGLPLGYLQRVANVESRGNPNARNPNSSAGGLFQFIDSTARQYGLSNRFDPAQATDAAARLARDNAAHLRGVLGRDPTPGELYLAHQQGAGGAANLLRNPDAPAVGVLGNDAFRLNGGRPGMTAAEFAQRWIGKIDGASPTPPAPTTPAQATAPQGTQPMEMSSAPPASQTGGLGGLGGMRPLAGDGMGDMLQMIGMALLASPSHQPLQAMPQIMMAMNAQKDRAAERRQAQANNDREFGFRQTESGRAQSNTDRGFGFQQTEAQRAQQNADRQFQIAQQQANRREQVPLQPIKDPAGNIIGTFNPVTGETRPIGGGQTPPASPTQEGATPAPGAAPAMPGGQPAAPPAAPRLGPGGVPIIPGIRTLTSREERAQYGISEADNRPYQIGADGKLSTPGGANITVNNGGDNKQIFDEMQARAAAARAAATGLASIQEARRAVEGGAIFGSGAETRLTLQKIAGAFGADTRSVVNTETFRSAIAPQVATMLRNTVGTANISNSDREYAQKAAGGDISLDQGSIKKLLDIMERGNRGLIEDHRRTLDQVYPEGPNSVRERALFGINAPTAPAAPAAANPAVDAARSAIQRGAPRDAVIKRLQEAGIDPTGL